jgi:D-glycero-D-manno-heptose 1,7-bisphosphate phosphatase
LISIGEGFIPHKTLCLFDLDDTLVKNSGYSITHSKLPWVDSAKEAIHEISKLPIGIGIVTNQASIAKRIYLESQIVDDMQDFIEVCKISNLRIDRIFICPHKDADFCECRKPKPGLVLRALEESGTHPLNALLFGNSVRDVEAGSRAHVKSFLVPSGKLLELVRSELRNNSFT